jgi:hypothetical protein
MNTAGKIEFTIDMLGNVKAGCTVTDQSGAVSQGPVDFAGALKVLALAYPSQVKALLTPVTTTTTTTNGSTTTTTSPGINIDLGLGITLKL